MSYQIKIDKRSLKAARFISRLQRTIQKAFLESGKTQQEIAVKLGVDRSVVNRRLKDSANLTARTIADFAFVLDKEIEVRLVDRPTHAGKNWALTAGSERDVTLGNSYQVGLTAHSRRSPRKEFEGADA